MSKDRNKHKTRTCSVDPSSFFSGDYGHGDEGKDRFIRDMQGMVRHIFKYEEDVYSDLMGCIDDIAGSDRDAMIPLLNGIIMLASPSLMFSPGEDTGNLDPEETWPLTNKAMNLLIFTLQLCARKMRDQKKSIASLTEALAMTKEA